MHQSAGVTSGYGQYTGIVFVDLISDQNDTAFHFLAA
jgi:hypothetical protein